MKKLFWISSVIMILTFFITGCSSIRSSSIDKEITTTPTITEKKVTFQHVIPTTYVYNPNIIDGIDFTNFNEGKMHFSALGNILDYDELKIIAVQGKVEAILSDGNKFTMRRRANYEDLPPYVYDFYIYSPKKVKYIDTSSEYVYFSSLELFGENYYNEHIPYIFNIDDLVTGEDIECSFLITYEDNTAESISIYITKDYINE